MDVLSFYFLFPVTDSIGLPAEFFRHEPKHFFSRLNISPIRNDHVLLNSGQFPGFPVFRYDIVIGFRMIGEPVIGIVPYQSAGT